MARNATRQTSSASAAKTLPAASNVINSSGTPNSSARALASATDTPWGSPPSPRWASTGLPKLMAALSTPSGASCCNTCGSIITRSLNSSLHGLANDEGQDAAVLKVTNLLQRVEAQGQCGTRGF